jgi:hypothetical protein
LPAQRSVWDSLDAQLTIPCLLILLNVAVLGEDVPCWSWHEKTLCQVWSCCQQDCDSEDLGTSVGTEQAGLGVTTEMWATGFMHAASTTGLSLHPQSPWSVHSWGPLSPLTT